MSCKGKGKGKGGFYGISFAIITVRALGEGLRQYGWEGGRRDLRWSEDEFLEFFIYFLCFAISGLTIEFDF
jgi:hypothetical protein